MGLACPVGSWLAQFGFTSEELLCFQLLHVSHKALGIGSLHSIVNLLPLLLLQQQQ